MAKAPLRRRKQKTPVLYAHYEADLYKESPLPDGIAKRALCAATATLLEQMHRIRMASIDGTITSDEARALPSLIGHIRKSLDELQVSKPPPKGPAALDID